MVVNQWNIYQKKNNYLNLYSYSKYLAEITIILSNNSKCKNENLKLLTCALRAHNIFGPKNSI